MPTQDKKHLFSAAPIVSLSLAQYAGTTTGLTVFALMIVRGLAVENPSTTVLVRALGGMFVAAAIGALAGWLARIVLEDQHHAGELGAAGTEDPNRQEPAPPADT